MKITQNNKTAICLNCNHEQELTINKNMYHDNLGMFTVCEKCGSSYDVKGEYKNE